MASQPITPSAARTPASTASARPGDPVPVTTPSPARWPIQPCIGSHHTRHRIATPESERETLRHFAALDDALVAVAARITLLASATAALAIGGASLILARAIGAALPRILP